MGFKERFHGIVIRAADRIFDRIPVDLVELRFQFDHGSGYIGIGRKRPAEEIDRVGDLQHFVDLCFLVQVNGLDRDPVRCQRNADHRPEYRVQHVRLLSIFRRITPNHRLRNIPPTRRFCNSKSRFVWEQRNAKELCNIGTGKSNTQDQIDDGIYPFFIRSDIPVKSNKFLYDCEAVITIGDGNIGKVFHYVNGKFDLHQRCYKMTDFHGVTGKYFFYFFSTHFYERAMKMTAKATVDSVRLEMIADMEIRYPKEIAEQTAIAEFFGSVDRLITLHQRE